MLDRNALEKGKASLKEGMSLTKCRQCGCMKEALENLRSSLESLKTEESAALLKDVNDWLKLMKPVKYSCLGCERCIAAETANAFSQALPASLESKPASCAFEVREQTWPPVAGEYFVLGDGPGFPVAVSTLASVELAEGLASMKPQGLCIVGKTETENIGVDKVIKNIITNPEIRFLVLAGRDPEGHHSGRTLTALWENGVDKDMRVIDSPGKRPVLKNVTREEVEAFKKQVQVIDLIGCEGVKVIASRIGALSERAGATCSCHECSGEGKPFEISTVPVIQARKKGNVQMDRSGYFVVIPRPEKGTILAEHYSYDNQLLRAIEGKDAASIYQTIIENGWVTQLSHAAYVGKELAKAELSLKLGFKYIQDGA